MSEVGSKALQVQGLRLRRFERNQQRMKDDASIPKNLAAGETKARDQARVNDDGVKRAKRSPDQLKAGKQAKPAGKVAKSKAAKSAKPGKRKSAKPAKARK